MKTGDAFASPVYCRHTIATAIGEKDYVFLAFFDGLALDGLLDGPALDGLALDGLLDGLALDGLALDGLLDGLALDGLLDDSALDGLALDGLLDDPALDGLALDLAFLTALRLTAFLTILRLTALRLMAFLTMAFLTARRTKAFLTSAFFAASLGADDIIDIMSSIIVSFSCLSYRTTYVASRCSRSRGLAVRSDCLLTNPLPSADLHSSQNSTDCKISSMLSRG